MLPFNKLIKRCHFIIILNFKGNLLSVGFDRVFKLELEEFLNEPTYVHRCKLVDDPIQRDTLEKYLDLLKSSPTKNEKYDLDGNCDSDDSLNSSHISIDTIEIDIDCLAKELTQIAPDNELFNIQYTIKVVDYKRIKSNNKNKSSGDCNESSNSLSDESKSQQRQGCHLDSFCGSKSVEVLNKDKISNDETNENTVLSKHKKNSSNYLDNTAGSTSIISCYVPSDLKTQIIDLNLKEKLNGHELRDLNQNESLYAISESTRIHAGDKDGNNTYDDIDNITQTNANGDFSQEKDKDATLNADAAKYSDKAQAMNDFYSELKSATKMSNGFVNFLLFTFETFKN